MPYSNDNLYDLLGIPPDASPDELRRAYRKLAMVWHPDRNPAAAAEETFKRIRYAYELLSDAERRAEYDQAGEAQAPPADDETAPSAATADRRAPDLHRTARISLYEQVYGGRVKLKVTRTEYCEPCHGSGIDPAPPATCPTCDGSGQMRRSLGLFAFFASEVVNCEQCAGQGVIQALCSPCQGSGIAARKTGYLRFEVAAGTVPGTLLRVRGHGRRARGAEAAGDLRVTIELAPHPLFSVDFPHLYCEWPVSVFRAALGGHLSVPTLDGAVDVALPANPGAGSELRLDGAGLLDPERNQRGDLFLKLQLICPEQLTTQQQDWLEQLDHSMSNHPTVKDWQQRYAAAMRQSGE